MNLNFNSNVRPQSKQEDYSEYNSQNKKVSISLAKSFKFILE